MKKLMQRKSSQLRKECPDLCDAGAALKPIVQFRVRYDRWIKGVKAHFLQA